MAMKMIYFSGENEITNKVNKFPDMLHISQRFSIPLYEYA